ncbi:hypothetical protein FJNA_24300 [Thermus sp. FJN-A]
MTGTAKPPLEEGAGPPEVPYPEPGPEDPSPLHAVARWVAAMWPWARFGGITARMWPHLEGRTLREGVDLGPLGVVWTDPPKTLWMWEPRRGD